MNTRILTKTLSCLRSCTHRSVRTRSVPSSTYGSSPLARTGTHTTTVSCKFSNRSGLGEVPQQSGIAGKEGNNMGTRAQIDIRQGNKTVVRVYTEFDGFPHNILPALRAAASAGYSKPLSIARAVIKQFGGTDILITDEDKSDYVSYRYAVDVSSKPWRVRQTEMAGW